MRKRHFGLGLAAAGAVAFLAFGWAPSVAAQDERPRPRNEDRIRRDIDSKCAGFRRKYDAAKKVLENARRGEVQAASDKYEAARADYCKCLTDAFAAAGLPLPPEYQRICNPGAAVDPANPAPDEFIIGRQPDVQALPGEPTGPDTGASPGGAPESEMDPCEKLAYDIKTLEEMEELYTKEKSKFPEPLRRKLRDLRRAYAECQKPGTGLAKPDPVLPETGKNPGTGSTGGAPNPPPPPPPPPPGGAFNPAGPGVPGGAIDRFFGDRTRQEFHGGAVFVTHSANHAAHCNVCLQVRDGVTVTFERSPTPGGIQVTVTDPPLPPIACQETAGGALECATATASFCQMTPTASIAHLKLGAGDVEDLGVRLDYPGGEAFQFCTHGRTTP